jgi:uncharacterized membrane protein
VTVVRFAVVGLAIGWALGAPEVGMLSGAAAAVVYGWLLDRHDAWRARQ